MFIQLSPTKDIFSQYISDNFIKLFKLISKLFLNLNLVNSRFFNDWKLCIFSNRLDSNLSFPFLGKVNCKENKLTPKLSKEKNVFKKSLFLILPSFDFFPLSSLSSSSSSYKRKDKYLILLKFIFNSFK